MSQGRRVIDTKVKAVTKDEMPLPLSEFAKAPSVGTSR
jgi:hypothetical protein